MIVLDTNVISALMREAPAPEVVAWLDRQPSESVWTTSITIFEVQFGLTLLPPGKRRSALQQAFEQVIAEDLEDRVLDFDRHASTTAAAVAALRQQDGRRMDMRDVQIAGICLARRATLATRNIRDFEGTAVSLVNPWEPSRD